MAEISLKAQKRALSTKGAVNELRRKGSVPGVYYAKSQEPIPISVTEGSLKPLVYTSQTHIVDLQIDGAEGLKSIVKHIQFHPVTDKIIHFDLLGINVKEVVEIEVPLSVTGSAKGIKDGGILQQSMHKVLISCLPTDIPNHLELDVTNLGIGDALFIKNLTEMFKYEFKQPEDVMVLSIIVPRSHETVESEEGTKESTEPEVIKKGKPEDEE
ncbi:MAG: 50S ribosomal protein L25 [Melioribacteraceae bacterium]|nr:50S ribosomal protein L25 [Melioribacteraceae bacterium]